jgi:hypothetical protein
MIESSFTVWSKIPSRFRSQIPIFTQTLGKRKVLSLEDDISMRGIPREFWAVKWPESFEKIYISKAQIKKLQVSKVSALSKG